MTRRSSLVANFYEQQCTQHFENCYMKSRIGTIASLPLLVLRILHDADPSHTECNEIMMSSALAIANVAPRKLCYTSRYAKNLVITYENVFNANDHGFTENKMLHRALDEIILCIVSEYTKTSKKIFSSKESNTLLAFLKSQLSIKKKITAILRYLDKKEKMNMLPNQGRDLFNIIVKHLSNPPEDLARYFIATPARFDALVLGDMSIAKSICLSVPEIANAPEFADAKDAVVARIVVKKIMLAKNQGVVLDMLQRNSMFAGSQVKTTGLCYDVLENTRSFLPAAPTTVFPYQLK